MEFTKQETLTFDQGVELLFAQLTQSRVMVLAASVGNHVTARSVSCLCYENKIYFKTDENFSKTRQLLENPNVALCWHGISVEGVAQNLGRLSTPAGEQFLEKFAQYYPEGYSKYNHLSSDILIEVSPTLVEVWDTDGEGYTRQVFVDFVNAQVRTIPYDVKKG